MWQQPFGAAQRAGCPKNEGRTAGKAQAHCERRIEKRLYGHEHSLISEISVGPRSATAWWRRSVPALVAQVASPSISGQLRCSTCQTRPQSGGTSASHSAKVSISQCRGSTTTAAEWSPVWTHAPPGPRRPHRPLGRIGVGGDRRREPAARVGRCDPPDRDENRHRRSGGPVVAERADDVGEASAGPKEAVHPCAAVQR